MHHSLAIEPQTRRQAGRRSGRLAAAVRRSWRFLERPVPGPKRTLDLVASGLGLLLLSPLFALVAAAIRLESPGPVFFSQVRVGEGGRPFRMLKFRSMYRDAEARKADYLARNESAGGVLFKMKRDPRITRVGRVIRKLSIDELPQLLNVLGGDMTLVGPRPPVPAEVAQYTLEQRRRLDLKPGITCLWQVSGRSDLPFEQQVALDAEYALRRSLVFDLALLLRTLPAVLTARGAY